MLSCLIIFNFFHPGQTLRGPRCDFSEENRQRKEEKKMRKKAKKSAKDERKAEVLLEKLEKKEAKKARKQEGNWSLDLSTNSTGYMGPTASLACRNFPSGDGHR